MVVDGMDEDTDAMPSPPALVTTPPPGLSADEEFAWRKACAHPTADAFAAFAFPAARFNEARCAILEGNWARALRGGSPLRRSMVHSRVRCAVGSVFLVHDRRHLEIPGREVVLGTSGTDSEAGRIRG